MEAHAVEVRNLSIGDVFEWCGRWVQITNIEVVRPRGTGSTKPGRHLYVTVPDVGPRRLHYFYNEWVKTLRPGVFCETCGGPCRDEAVTSQAR